MLNKDRQSVKEVKQTGPLPGVKINGDPEKELICNSLGAKQKQHLLLVCYCCVFIIGLLTR